MSNTTITNQYTCEEGCNRTYKSLKTLYNHYCQCHPKSHKCADLLDAHNRAQYDKRKKQPIIADGLNYRQFLKAKSDELKQSRPDITDSKDRLKLIGEMWKELKNGASTSNTTVSENETMVEETNEQPMTIAQLLDMIAPNTNDIKSPEPEELPMPMWVQAKPLPLTPFMEYDIIYDSPIYEPIVIQHEEELEEEETQIQQTPPTIVEECVVEQVESVTTFDNVLLECCRTMNEGGFARAFHYLNNPNKFHVIPKYTTKTIEGMQYTTRTFQMFNGKKYVPTMLCYIRDEIEHVYDTLCEIWGDYKMSYYFDVDDLDVFDEDKDWLDVCQYLINEDNIEQFFKL